MLKVCGVTFDCTTNYGSCLQAYALQKTIEAVNMEGDEITYQLLPLSLWKRNKYKTETTHLTIKRFVMNCLIKYRRRQFEQFELEHMKYADIHNIYSLNELNNRYDAFVCGSDVIWNLDFTHAESAYFLEFANKYKFSYAASFGVHDIDKDYETWKGDRTPREIFKQSLSSLNQISIRERDSLHIIKELTGKEAVHVCDPVMLLTVDEWISIMKEKKKVKKYIFAYSTYISPNYLNFLNKLHKQTGLPVYHVTWNIKAAIRYGVYNCPGPQKWLALLKNAEYVVTNSFHATVFSCMFHKIFFVPMRDAQIKGTRIRIYDFLADISVEGRVFGNTPETIDLTPPDYIEADKKISISRQESLQFIYDNIIMVKRQSISQK